MRERGRESRSYRSAHSDSTTCVSCCVAPKQQAGRPALSLLKSACATDDWSYPVHVFQRRTLSRHRSCWGYYRSIMRVAPNTSSLRSDAVSAPLPPRPSSARSREQLQSRPRTLGDTSRQSAGTPPTGWPEEALSHRGRLARARAVRESPWRFKKGASTRPPV